MFFFVLHNGVADFYRIKIQVRGQVQPLEQPDNPFSILSGQQSPVTGKTGRRHHSSGNGSAVTGRIELFNGMAEGVSEIELPADTGFFFILLNHPGLDGHGTGYQVKNGFRIQGQCVVLIVFNERQHVGVRDKRVFDNFGQAVGNFRRRQGGKHGWVADHKPGLGEHPGHVFVSRHIHPVFPPDTGIDLRKQRGGDKPEIHSPHEYGRHKPCDITDNTPADAQNKDRPVTAVCHQRFQEELHRSQGFDPFTRADADDRCFRKCGGVMGLNIFIGNDHQRLVRQVIGNVSQARAHMNG